jgi:hypothetical protein
MKFSKQSESGSVLVSVIIILPFLILIIGYYMQLALNNYRLGFNDELRTHAQLGTDAAIDYALQQVNSTPAWTGTSTPTELHNDGRVRVTYTVIVTDTSPNQKVLTATGRSYSPVTDTNPDSTVKINVTLRAVKSGNYSIVTGVGGLYLSNSAKIVGGDVLVNGEISLQNTAQIGLTTNPVTVKVAHQTCPISAPFTDYPRICNPGENGQPINILNSAKIYGTVQANNQTTGTAMTNPGLKTPNCTQPYPIDGNPNSNCVKPQDLPPHDRAAQKAAIPGDGAHNLTGAAASCGNNQTRTWLANTKITGNVLISGNCVVNVQGNVWITGKFELQNSSIAAVSDALGTTQPVLMVDDVANFSQSSQLKSNSSETGFEIITYKSSKVCSPDPTCETVTGQDLFNSRNLVSITLDNSAAGPDTIFYARWSRVLINNAGEIGALVGQTIELKNSGTISFGSSVPGLSNVYWVISKYQRNFN